MKPTVQIDPRPFNAVMQDYARLNRRTFPEIVNKEALDVAFGALSETPKANPADIKGMENKKWWPKKIAKEIAEGVSFTITTNNAFHGRMKMKKTFKGKFTRAQAKEVSRRIIGARLRAVAFVKSGWLPAIGRLWPLVKDKGQVFRRAQGAKIRGVEKGTAKPAVAGDHPTALIVNSALGVERVGVPALQRAIDKEIVDMGEYIARKLEGNARRVAR